VEMYLEVNSVWAAGGRSAREGMMEGMCRAAAEVAGQ
jgi:hypothetical protein